MTRFRLATIAATLALLAATPGWAQSANRAWVSGRGTDAAGCGAPTAPCRSLQYVHDHIVIAGGEIDILDPAGYGAITITKAISIVNDGVGTAGVQTTSGPAIDINAGPSDAIYLRGLSIDGVQQQGLTGVALNSAGRLTVADCVVRRFAGAGLSVEPVLSGTFQLLVLNTVLADNGGDGLFAQPLGANTVFVGTIDHVVATGNVFGIHLTSGNTAAATAVYAVTNTTASNNSSIGFVVVDGGNHTSSVEIDSSYLNNNGALSGSGDGLFVGDGFTVRLSRSSLDQNGKYGVENGVTSAGGVYSAGDNHMDGNPGGKVFGPALLSEVAN